MVLYVCIFFISDLVVLEVKAVSCERLSELIHDCTLSSGSIYNHNRVYIQAFDKDVSTNFSYKWQPSGHLHVSEWESYCATVQLFSTFPRHLHRLCTIVQPFVLTRHLWCWRKSGLTLKDHTHCKSGYYHAHTLCPYICTVVTFGGGVQILF